MSSREPHFGDKLDTLLRGALDSLVAGQEPPDHIWPRIRAELTSNTSSLSRPRCRRLVPVLPVALAVLLIALQGANPWQMRSLFREAMGIPTRDWPPPVARVYVEPQSAPPAALTPLDEIELHFLKTHSPLRTKRQPSANHRNRPVVIAAVDVLPHPASPEGRLLKAERSDAAIPVEEQRFLTGGPHRW